MAGTTKRRRIVTVDSLLASRKDRTPGCHYKLDPSAASLAIDIAGDPTFDESNMTATAVISTPTIDRVGDLLFPRGCKVDNYAKNPVVLWAHGFDGGLNLPVGRSEDESGNLTVNVADNDVTATCHFSQTLKTAAQIFDLIVEKIVRATSVRETPIKSSFERDPNLGDILVVEEWELEEWSWCCVGANPDAVAKALDRGKLAGSPIEPSILKSLSAIAPKFKRFGVGFKSESASGICPHCNSKAVGSTDGNDTCEKGHVYPSSSAKQIEEVDIVSKKSYRKAAILKMSPAELEQAKEDADETSMEAIESEETKRAKEAEVTTETDTTVESESTTMPYGAQVVSAVHASLAGAVANIEQSMGPLENPEVKTSLSEIMGALQEQMTALEGLYAGTYPDQPALKMDGTSEDPEGEMKSWLATGRLPQLQMSGVGARLKQVASAKNLTPGQRTMVRGVMDHLQRMQVAAKSSAKPTGDTETKALADKVAAAQKELESLQK